MNFDGNFRTFAQVNIQPVQKLVAGFSESDWQQNSLRQQKFKAHHSTDTIFIKFINKSHCIVEEDIIQKIQPTLDSIIDNLQKTFGYTNIDIERIILTRLKPKTEISRHRDKGLIFETNHRLHIPIQTNEKVSFTVGKEQKCLQQGKMYEINNRRLHSVKNASNESRIHMIVDCNSRRSRIEFIKNKCTTHLFLAPINNSGSTYLKKILRKCAKTIFFKKEGQFVADFCGPVPKDKSLSFLWANDPYYPSILQNDSHYDWKKIKDAWYYAASFHYRKGACVFLEKSPPNIARISLLQRNFSHAKFIFTVRNPYAIIESTKRSRKDVYNVNAAANHVVNCLRIQRDNIEKFPNSIFFTYEQMCDNYREIEQKIKYFLPELEDINLNQKIPIKRRYNEFLRNMNEEQVARLSVKEIESIRPIFGQNRDILDYFGYEIL
ncbi:aspartyl/asparaginyl beta-hydroxylase domain-containing protein [Candidatus Uabimicrobium amorphum]|uniref:Aspartyl/asparaginyl beta-hydroxylase n=1 Tax=Uabimicrobium amorphum TaxID=2596890 RepID=A0A5S9IL09_UABAM|nr:aspartyl/asparaginyl beta-hydroxylase domain-containing protein [Candidatus Uabimicrobium amorphum]BBM83302.1 aspartyl/asparaginyl beta-hydroxylase [Candidatus Uabimicrobium amorphum]